jgi:hypothetical protein
LAWGTLKYKCQSKIGVWGVTLMGDELIGWTEMTLAQRRWLRAVYDSRSVLVSVRTYISVVCVLACPSHNATLRMSPVDWSAPSGAVSAAIRLTALALHDSMLS